MKVCTDSCLFGALIEEPNPQKALDIGTGTGLLSLMVAQRHPQLLIDAVEIDAEAANDAIHNFGNSIFSQCIKLHLSSFQAFEKTVSTRYDLIFSNPPFYNNQLQSPDSSRNMAHHSSHLSFEELCDGVNRLLTETGSLWILLPPVPMLDFIKRAAEYGLVPYKFIRVRHNPQKNIFREIAVFSRNTNKVISEVEINIYENEVYSSIFTSLLKEYYLKL